MQKYTITTTENGHEIYANLINSSVGPLISRQPRLIGLVKEALTHKRLTGKEMAIQQDMGRVIGNTDIVQTGDNDVVFYARVYKKDVFSRFVKNLQLKPSTELTIILKQDDNQDYEVTNVWIGPFAPPFPGDEEATDSSKPYWENHALVFGDHNIQSKSITKVCPY